MGLLFQELFDLRRILFIFIFRVLKFHLDYCYLLVEIPFELKQLATMFYTLVRTTPSLREERDTHTRRTKRLLSIVHGTSFRLLAMLLVAQSWKGYPLFLSLDC